MIRPFFSKSIEELEIVFDRRRDDPESLDNLIEELSHRTTQRASKLKTRAVQALGTIEKSGRREGADVPPMQDDQASPQPPRSAPRPTEPKPSPMPQEPRPVPEPSLADVRPVEQPMPPITDSPTAVLSAWTALEVLSPPSFRRPEDLAAGDKRAVAKFEHGRLPWDGAGERSRRNMRLFYQVVLGTVKLEEAVTKLMARYSDTRAEKPAARARAYLPWSS
jgi:hypothetical protein